MGKDVSIKKKLKLKTNAKRQFDVPEVAQSSHGRQLSVKAGFQLETVTKEVIETSAETESEFLPSKTHKLKISPTSADEFVTRSKIILEKLDYDRMNSVPDPDSDIMYDYYKLTLADTLEMIPKAKSAYMRWASQQNASAYNALVTKCQELIADIQALSSKGDLLERILETSIDPAFKAIVSNSSNNYIEYLDKISKLDIPESKKTVVQSLFKNYVRELVMHLQEVERGLHSDLKGRLGDGN